MKSIKSYNIGEAAENFATILKDVEAGEQVLLMRYGTPIARIQPIDRERPAPGFMTRAGFSVRISDDFDEIPPDFGGLL